MGTLSPSCLEHGRAAFLREIQYAWLKESGIRRNTNSLLKDISEKELGEPWSSFEHVIKGRFDMRLEHAASILRAMFIYWRAEVSGWKTFDDRSEQELRCMAENLAATLFGSLKGIRLGETFEPVCWLDTERFNENWDRIVEAMGMEEPICLPVRDETAAWKSTLTLWPHSIQPGNRRLQDPKPGVITIHGLARVKPGKPERVEILHELK